MKKKIVLSFPPKNSVTLLNGLSEEEAAAVKTKLLELHNAFPGRCQVQNIEVLSDE
jgi:hypothetical protein